MGHRIRDLQRAQQRSDTPEEIRDRILYRQASELGIADRKADPRYATITAENFDAAADFQQARIAFHFRALIEQHEQQKGGR